MEDWIQRCRTESDKSIAAIVNLPQSSNTQLFQIKRKRQIANFVCLPTNSLALRHEERCELALPNKGEDSKSSGKVAKVTPRWGQVTSSQAHSRWRFLNGWAWYYLVILDIASLIKLTSCMHPSNLPCFLVVFEVRTFKYCSVLNPNCSASGSCVLFSNQSFITTSKLNCAVTK